MRNAVFKAVRADVFRALAPSIQDNEWFFDTELLLVKTAVFGSIKLVYWVEDPNSLYTLLTQHAKTFRA